MTLGGAHAPTWAWIGISIGAGVLVAYAVTWVGQALRRSYDRLPRRVSRFDAGGHVRVQESAEKPRLFDQDQSWVDGGIVRLQEYVAREGRKEQIRRGWRPGGDGAA